MSTPEYPSPGVVVDPATVERSARGAEPGAAADRLAAAARALVAAVHAAVPAELPERPAGGRAGPLAATLADRWAAEARAWAADVRHHRDHVAGVAPAFVALDDAGAAALRRVGP